MSTIFYSCLTFFVARMLCIFFLTSSMTMRQTNTKKVDSVAEGRKSQQMKNFEKFSENL